MRFSGVVLERSGDRWGLAELIAVLLPMDCRKTCGLVAEI